MCLFHLPSKILHLSIFFTNSNSKTQINHMYVIYSLVKVLRKTDVVFCDSKSKKGKILTERDIELLKEKNPNLWIYHFNHFQVSFTAYKIRRTCLKKKLNLDFNYVKCINTIKRNYSSCEPNVHCN